jgi:hypothetical protein
MNMNDFKFERGMYWEIAEFDGSQEEALAFIVPKIMEQGFKLENYLQDQYELFYQPSCGYEYIGITSDDENIFIFDNPEHDAEFTEKQSWDVFKPVELINVEEGTSELEEAYARIDSLEELVAELSEDRAKLLKAVKELLNVLDDNKFQLDKTDFEGIAYAVNIYNKIK